MTKTLLKVGGMTCGGCQRSVQGALEGSEGVLRATVDLAAGKAEILHDPSKSTPETLRLAVEEAGFDAALIGEPAS